MAVDLTIVTGMSGAGRSAAADGLEDLGFFVIDNLPPALISKVAELAGSGERSKNYAVVVDVRSGSFVDDLVAALAVVHEQGVRTQILFLDASDDVLVRRFEASRRPHPLADATNAGEGTGIASGIERERILLESIKGQSDLIIDTSSTNVQELRNRVREVFGEPGSDGLNVSLVTFGFKHGVPLGVDLLFDCRFLPNPYWDERLRPLTGESSKVKRAVLRHVEAKDFLAELERMLGTVLPAYAREGKSHLSIGLGCTGGRHRSVVLAGEVAKTLSALGYPAQIHHRDIERD
ncbi:MAG: RNase adapter RapZ [Acidimicrobiia bacterium]|nr:RNase adapter RapZ [Acidimicrobiia bacterium]